MIAAGAMALSSLSVVGNANRLRRWPTPLPAAEAITTAGSASNVFRTLSRLP